MVTADKPFDDLKGERKGKKKGGREGGREGGNEQMLIPEHAHHDQDEKRAHSILQPLRP